MTQINKILSRFSWNNVIIQENNEPLVELVETPKLKLGGVHKEYEPLFLVRKTIAEKLYKISELLPSGIVLVVIEGYRSTKHQQYLWDENFQKVKTENLQWSDEEIDKQVRLVIARPHPLANHHCGGAVDVTLAYESGEMLDMGSPYPAIAYGDDTRIKFPMFSDRIEEYHELNRKLLRAHMEREDFIWYPGEWWHYCYGDRMWAVYSEKLVCFYGPIEP